MRPIRFLLTVFVAVSCVAQTPQANIELDQVGYLPGAAKLAVVTAPAEKFAVKRVGDNATVLEGKLSAAVADKDTGDKVQSADFSRLKAPGSYYLEVAGVGRSYKFSIAPDVYARPFYMTMLGFYGQRCGTTVDLGPEFPEYKHPACHMDNQFHATSGKKGPAPISGGWHDAGDYGRYVVNSGITTGTLRWTWEMFGDKVKKVKLYVPESGNGTPDILNEARFNIEWMLKMQDDDGGAFIKEANERFPGFISPEDDKDISYVIGTGKPPYKSTCATADLAAVTAIAARVYKPFDAKFAEQNLKAATAAFAWTEKYPAVTFRNPPGIQSGEYGDNDCGDEVLWAAAELWRTTGDAAYNKYFVANYAKYMDSMDAQPAENWAHVGSMGLWTYAMAHRKDADAAAVAEIKKRTITAANQIVEKTRENPYHTSLQTKDYVWGSNGIAASYSVHLLVSNYIAPDPSYVAASLDNIHYILGRNAFSLSYVTQVGENAYKHPHHRPSLDTSKLPWPGLLSGGPNMNRQDAVTKKLPPDTPPAKVYVDELGSYASNEIAINWQAALVFSLAGNLP